MDDFLGQADANSDARRQHDAADVRRHDVAVETSSPPIHDTKEYDPVNKKIGALHRSRQAAILNNLSEPVDQITALQHETTRHSLYAANATASQTFSSARPSHVRGHNSPSGGPQKVYAHVGPGSLPSSERSSKLQQVSQGTLPQQTSEGPKRAVLKQTSLADVVQA